MNRIQLAGWTTDEATPRHKPQIAVEHALLSTAAQPGLHFTLFAPLHYERNYSYPLVVWLHGPGDDERQLRRVMPLVSMKNYVAVGPRGTCAHEDSPGFYWGDDEISIDAAEYAVLEAVDTVQKKFNVARPKIFLAGFQCGGTTAFHVGLRNPNLFAGVLSLGGPFPVRHTPLRRLTQLRRLPLFIAQGRDSTAYPIERTCEELRLFHAAGMNITLRQYPCGDELTTQMLHDMDVWLMERVTGQKQTPQPSQPPLTEAN